MREHKFQAWCRGKLYRPFTLQNAGKYDISIGEAVEEGTERITCGWPEDTIFREYTGLKDSKGVDIYEGDILKRVGYNYKHIIQWYAQSCGFNLAWVSDSINADLDVKIIGNIYENPELGDK